MNINFKLCIKSIVAWNQKKSWANYKAVCKHSYINWHNIPRPIWAIYTYIKTIWNTLTGKYQKVEQELKNDGRLDYYLKDDEEERKNV